MPSVLGDWGGGHVAWGHVACDDPQPIAHLMQKLSLVASAGAPQTLSPSEGSVSSSRSDVWITSVGADCLRALRALVSQPGWMDVG